MLLKKKVKAGILLYALLMLAVFSLLLQFYLHRQEAESRLVQVARQEKTAYIMAQMVLDQVEEDLQRRQVVDEKVAIQTEDEKGDGIVASETVDGKEKMVDGGFTSETQENAEKTVHASSEQSKPIEAEGSMLFREGQVSYHVKNRNVSVNVNLRNGGKYHYRFPVKIVSEGSD
ncbi:competence protein ComGG [Streptococcus suis]|uniref:Competence type IV pilus minor pilin ComGG n=1 Tax=Streptococcus suivaginalis TaxID=3028082 RepID=A0AA96VLP0_9STRE|nr:competence type IV pilus minor pilin ComGG [Streptococcus sp. 29896]MCK4028471.1 competence protein ComGG [Streptococcus suis]NQM09802.1 competence protein ComGG [Streptococcus suis]WNY47249.1 competence type IV pilus minor pilin ComGG [Streptococcus sp. 29896]HEM4142223.1 competence protein ComGG [Streptococcus suis]